MTYGNYSSHWVKKDNNLSNLSTQKMSSNFAKVKNIQDLEVSLKVMLHLDGCYVLPIQ
jgi:hypothetical protein